jgi:prenyltransferase beta subunit
MSTKTTPQYCENVIQTYKNIKGIAMENGDREMLIRIDERIKQLVKDVQTLKGSYVLKQDFEPVKRIVYGMVAVILLGVLGALLKIIIL